MSERTESCYEHKPRMCRVYKANEGVPITTPVLLKRKTGEEVEVSRREYKKLRALAKKWRRNSIKKQTGKVE